ncbi:HAMP domain-containing protein [Asticcacaulis machinosus]|uniref:HAMP domain-containing protein n=1 Tax=Asticcacaulis machinosus TaxID=2984211 RepID=A0ABT5HN00_9CAUL|nr:HAMP domain-containing protein [Asticcacaulis machinosus]MDC7677630.1 HAMP domain-containing protein [Asticcacaulis machinosus]
MSIRFRFLALVAGFALMALAIAGLGVASIMDYRRILSDYTTAHEIVHKGERLNGLVSSAVSESRGIYNAANPQAAQVFAGRLEGNLTEIEAVLREPATLSPDLVTQAQAFVAFRRELIRLGTQVSPAAADQHGNNEANRQTRMAFQADLEHWVQGARLQLDRHRQIAQTYGDGRVSHFIVVAVIGLIIMIALSLWWAIAYISRPLQGLASQIVRVSEGNYDTVNAPSDARAGDEISAVQRALALLAERAQFAEAAAKAEREAEQKKALEMRQILLD